MTAALAQSVIDQFGARPRVLLGIAGPPGAGKSTLAAALARELHGAVVALDGFHYTNAELAARDLRARKGSAVTFHVGQLIARLQLIRSGHTARVPAYSRVLHDPMPDAVRVARDTQYVIVEGNYLLLDLEPWRGVRQLLDACWYLDAPLDVCLARVRARHLTGGCNEPEADRKLRENDRPNAELVIATRELADRVIDGSAL